MSVKLQKKTSLCSQLQKASLSYLKYLENVKSASEHTLRAYKNDLYTLVQHSHNLSLNSHNLQKWNKKTILSWAYLSSASRNRKIACLKGFFQWLFEEKMIEDNISLSLSCPKVTQRLPSYLSLDEITSLLQVFKKKKDKPDLLLILLLYGGGLRVSEACALKWMDIQWNEKVIRVLGKGQKERLIVLPQKVWTLLKELKLKGKDQTNQKVFSFTTRTAYEKVRTWGKKACLLKPLHPHALRHSFATHLLSDGVNLRTLQALLGHSSLTATQKYTHLNLRQLAQTLEKKHPLGKN